MEMLTKTYSADFFADRVELYHKWLDVAPTINGSLCHDQWTRLILQEDHGGYYFDLTLTNLRENQTTNTLFPFSAEAPNQDIPRALFLGDSVSRGVWAQLISGYSNRGVHLAGAPANCYGFKQYQTGNALSHWLGPCPWDFVQFNIGLHFHPKPNGDWRSEYKEGILEVVQKIHLHSPSAKIVIALTTPSPLDTNATFPPNDGSCPDMEKFHKTGFVSSMNDVIRSLLVLIERTNETIPGLWGINDRYSLMIPDLVDYQKPCDVHFEKRGYERIRDEVVDTDTFIHTYIHIHKPSII